MSRTTVNPRLVWERPSVGPDGVLQARPQPLRCASAFTTVSSANVAANATTFTTGNVTRTTWYVRIGANNVLGSPAWSPPAAVTPAP